MADGIRVEGDADLLKLAAAYKAADKPIRAQISKALREVGKPIAKDILREGAQGLPHRGGLSAKVAAGTTTVTQTLGGQTVGVALALRAKGAKNLRRIDSGTVRHPVFQSNRAGLFRRKTVRGKGGHILGGADRKDQTWVNQSVTPHLFTEAFKRHEARATQAMERAVAQAANDIERQA